MSLASEVRLLRVDHRWVIRVGVGIEVDLASVHVVEELGLLVHHVLVEGLAHFDYQYRQYLDEGVASSVFEVQLEVAVARQQVHIGRARAP